MRIRRRGHVPGVSGPAAPAQGETSPAQGETQQPVPRLPHERDESSDDQAPRSPSMERVGRQAHEDLERGVPDTSRSVETDATYHRLREPAPPGEVEREEKAGGRTGEDGEAKPVSPPAPPASRQ
ncbi:hypothetical protein ACT80S_10225 [Ramlibacter sp. MAHUQ-53]|uniref:hypothetical protein n=1 Tax=unclassified Ramlibacter TaxID=2617605 RepID=UPI0036269AD5